MGARARATTGTITGASERPSRSTLETRKADATDTKTARHALRSLHLAERQLLRASQGAETTKALAECASRSALATSAKAQAITGHFADKVAALSKDLTGQQRAAAIAQLKLEEGAALANMYLEAARESEQERRSVVGLIKARHRSASAGLSRRHRIERGALAVALGVSRSPSSYVSRPAVRRLAQRIYTRRPKPGGPTARP